MNLQLKNEIVRRQDNIVELKCSNCDDTFLIDEDDFERVRAHKWYKHDGYIKTNLNGITRLHHLIKEVRVGFDIDHKNQNKLDNRQDNLRYATRSQNNMNRGKQVNNTSGYKGVSLDKRNNKYAAYIKFEGRRQFLGYYNTAREAALAYNNKARELCGEFAVLNDV